MLAINVSGVTNNSQQINRNTNFLAQQFCKKDTYSDTNINNNISPSKSYFFNYSYCANPISFSQLKPQLAGKKFKRYFIPTPEVVIKTMTEKAKIKYGDKILEPSAGQGDIINHIRSLYGDNVTIHAAEINEDLRKVLTDDKFELVAEDIFKYKPTMRYNKILMNPPFKGLEFSKHILYCYDKLLKPGGTLVAVVPNRPFELHEENYFSFLHDYVSSKLKNNFIDSFEELLEITKNKEICLEFQDLPYKIFTKSDRPTNMDTKLLVLRKPHINTEQAPVRVAAAT